MSRLPLELLRRAAVSAAVVLTLGAAAKAAPVQIYAAGSRSGATAALIAASGQPADVFAAPVFGPAGLLADRLGKGETADLFASADLAAPGRLAAARPGTRIVPFVRNRMCVAAKPSIGPTDANLMEKLPTPAPRRSSPARC